MRHLASVVFPLDARRDGCMLMLNAYFDETGAEDDPQVFVAGMGGCLAPVDHWENRFEKPWQRVLNEYGIAGPFHMNEFAHSSGEFKKFRGKQQIRDAFINDLWDVVEDLNPLFVGCFVPLENYRKTLSVAQRQELMGVYQQTYVSCLATIFYVVHNGVQIHGVEPRVQVVLEYKQGVQQDAFGIYDAIHEKAKGAYREMIAPPVFQPKSLAPLQLADMLAYECQKEMRRPLYHQDKQPRLGFRRLQAILDKQLERPVLVGKTDSPIIFHPPNFADGLINLVPE